MKTLLWALVLAVGFGLMFFSYWQYQRIVDATPWTTAFMCVGRGDAKAEAEVEGLAHLPARVRLLPMPDRPRALAKLLRPGLGTAARALENAFCEKAVLLPSFRGEVTAAMLASGRLPEPGAAEVVAGAQATHTTEVPLGGRLVRVVGVLNRSASLFADSYVVAADSAAADLFDPADEEVHRGYIFRMSRAQAAEPDVRQRLRAAFPEGRFDTLAAAVRVDAGSYYLYLAGLGLLLLGGSALFLRLYGYLARVVQNRLLGPPLKVLRDWRRLLALIHAVCFGSLLLMAAVAYYVPEVQTILLSQVHQTIKSGSGPLGAAGEAYMSGSILRAAVTTVAVNFLVGSLASITVPSVILPGVGALMAWFRAGLIGLILAPTVVPLSGVMLPHSLTLLVEMEAYFVAALFALMIPIYLFRKSEGPSVGRRYGRALVLNLKANVLVLAMLVVVGLYEAIEVILQMG